MLRKVSQWGRGRMQEGRDEGLLSAPLEPEERIVGRVNGAAGLPSPLSTGLRLQWTRASCFQTQRTRAGGHQDVLLLQRQVSALRGHLAELRAATERCVPATLPTQSQAWAPSGSGRRAPDAGPRHRARHAPPTGGPMGVVETAGEVGRGGDGRMDRVRQARVQGREERQAS